MRDFVTYKIIHHDSGRFYYGSTKNVRRRWAQHRSCLRRKVHHSIFLQHAVNKYGIDAFDFVVDKEFTDGRSMLRAEFEVLNDPKVRKTLFNMSRHVCGGDQITGHPQEKQIRERQAAGSRKWHATKLPSFFALPGISNGMFGNHHSLASRLLMGQTQRIRNVQRGFCHWSGKHHTTATKQKMSLIASLRLGAKNPFFGKHHSEETKEKIRQTQQGKTNTACAHQCKIDNITYRTCGEAAKALGVCAATITYRFKKQWPGYEKL